MFENKYYFVDHFKNEIVNNIDFICEQVLSKNKNLPDFNEENIIGKFKKLLSCLGVDSKLIDEQMTDLSEEETNLFNQSNEFEADPLNSSMNDQKVKYQKKKHSHLKKLGSVHIKSKSKIKASEMVEIEIESSIS